MIDDEHRQLAAARARLVGEFAGRVDAASVESVFDSVVAAYAEAPVRTFVPVLAARQVRRTLAVERVAGV